MCLFKAACVVSLLILGSHIQIAAEVQIDKSSIEAASSLFKEGKLIEAEKICAKVLVREPKNIQAAVLMGRIALLANSLDKAQKWLTKAIELRPEDPEPKSLLAEVFYRRDNFQKAAPLLRAIAREASAKKLESFKGSVPYQIEGKAEIAHLRFVQTDPLPVIQVRVNESEEVNFIIDTGGPEVIIDSEFANRVNAAQFGSETGTFGGGKQADYQHGRIESLTLGEFKVRNVPVRILNTRRFSAVAGGRRIDGILGTVLLYRFLSTLDYPQGKLILRRKTKENLKRVVQAQTEKHFVVPFWMAADHYIVAWGSVNKSEPLLMFIDTGLAGLGFTAPNSTLKEAGIQLVEEQASEGVGGGGKIKIIPFVVNELTLGDVKEKNIGGVAGAFPAALENSFGFRIGGLLSHGFFRLYAVTIDFTGMRLFLKKKES